MNRKPLMKEDPVRQAARRAQQRCDWLLDQLGSGGKKGPPLERRKELNREIEVALGSLKEVAEKHKALEGELVQGALATIAHKALQGREIFAFRHALSHGLRVSTVSPLACANRTILHLAAGVPRPSFLDAIIQTGQPLDLESECTDDDDDWMTVLVSSARSIADYDGRTENLHALIDLGADVTAVGSFNQMNFLMNLIQGNMLVEDDELIALYDKAKARGFDLFQETSHGATLLMYACSHGHGEFARKLAIEGGVELINKKNHSGESAMSFAKNEGFYDIAEMLEDICQQTSAESILSRLDPVGKLDMDGGGPSL